jgi:hypothetical protein
MKQREAPVFSEARAYWSQVSAPRPNHLQMACRLTTGRLAENLHGERNRPKAIGGALEGAIRRLVGVPCENRYLI